MKVLLVAFLLMPAFSDSPRTYVAPRASQRPVIDGQLSDPVWKGSSWSERFLDIQGESMPAPPLETRFKLAWDQEFLYVAASLEEANVWGSLTARDSVIFHDPDFEIFLDPDGDHHQYVEIELNALNTVWDLLLERPYRDGGPARNEFDIRGLATAVQVAGTLNDSRDIDRGWSVEMAIPWSAFRGLTEVALPPREGDQWRINFSRVQWHVRSEGASAIKLPDTPEENWVWSPQGEINMHLPEKWGYVQFSEFAEQPFVADESASARERLMDLYYAQKEFFAMHQRWATTFSELNFTPVEGMQLSLTQTGYEAVLACGSPRSPKQCRLTEDSRIRVDPGEKR